MPKLYPITEEEWPATGKREVLYEVATGRILMASDAPFALASGERAMIASEAWAVKTVVFAGFQLAEFANGNIKLGIGGNPTLIGPKTYTNVKPV